MLLPPQSRYEMFYPQKFLFALSLSFSSTPTPIWITSIDLYSSSLILSFVVFESDVMPTQWNFVFSGTELLFICFKSFHFSHKIPYLFAHTYTLYLQKQYIYNCFKAYLLILITVISVSGFIDLSWLWATFYCFVHISQFYSRHFI